MATEVIDLKVPLIRQKNSKICWHASYKMMYEWNGRPKADVDKKWPNPGQTGSDTEDGLKPSQWRRAAAIMKLASVDAIELKKIKTLFFALKNWGPIWTTGKFIGGGSYMHTIVIGGANLKNSKLLLCDPWEIYKTGETRWTHISWWEKLVDTRAYSCQTWLGA